MNKAAWCRKWFMLPIAAFIVSVQVPAGAQSYTFLRKFGSAGSGSGQFGSTTPASSDGPEDVALDSAGNIYVVDNTNNRVEKFTNAGVYVSQFGTAGSGTSSGTSIQLNAPVGLTVDSSNNIFVADTGNSRVQKVNSSFVFQTAFGANTGTGGSLQNPYDVALDAAGNAYVSDYGQSLIQKFTNTAGVYTFNSSIGASDLMNPTKIAVDGNGNIFVSDNLHFRVLEYNSSGVVVRSFVNGLGTFNPQGLAISSTGTLYVADNTNNQVFLFNASAAASSNPLSNPFTPTSNFGSAGNNDGQFNGADGVALDSAGNVYVTDLGNNRVEVFGLAAVPETGSLLMLSGMAAGGIFVVKRKKKSRKE